MQAFTDSSEHLLAELERIDLLIRARVAYLRGVQAEDEHFRGLYISELEVDALLDRPLGAPAWLQAVEGRRMAGVDAAWQRLTRSLAARREASRAQGIDLRLDRLARTFGLDDFDVEVLLVCLAVEIDLRYEKLYAYLQDDVTKKRPSVDLAIHLLAATGSGALTAMRHFVPSAPLLAHQIVRLVEDPSQPQSPLLARILKPDDRIVQFLAGADDVDTRLGMAVRAAAPSRGLDGLMLDEPTRAAFRNAWPAGHEGATPPALLLRGPGGSGKASVAEALCHERGLPLLVADVAALATVAPSPALTSTGDEAQAAAPTTPWPAIVAAVEREAALRGAAVHWRGLDALSADAQKPARAALLRALDGGRAPCFVAAPDDIDATVSFPRRGAVTLRMPEATHAQRTAAWQHALSGAALGAKVDLAGLATRFKLTLGKIDAAAATARRLSRLHGGAQAVLTLRDLQDACRMHSNQQLTALARKTSPQYQWGDIVLPADRLAQMREICNHVKYRDRVFGDWGFGRKLALGKGLAVLFAGPSGTGKTMAAGIIAAELGLDLYKIDLSTVISKYIGETEKNLSRIFDEAETSNAILFFDEADALFGKRSEVRDSHDRYANIEVGYLLQRMEEYEGIAILATNFRKNMDDAFVRRLHFTLEFPFPDVEDRHRIWLGIWPKDTPRDSALDLRLLAQRYEMTGGNIKNIALAASFLAADEDQVVRMHHVVQATLREYQKTGKLMGDHDDL